MRQCSICGNWVSEMNLGHQCPLSNLRPFDPVNAGQPMSYPSGDTQYFLKTIVELSKELGQLKGELERALCKVKEKEAEIYALRVGKS